MKRRWTAVLLLLLAACHSSKPAPSEVPKDSPFFYPSFLPTGFKVQDGAVLTSGPQHKAFGAALGRPAGAGKFDAVVLVTAAEADGDRVVTAAEKVTSVDVGAIHARLHDDAEVGAYVDWFANGVAVSVSGQSGTGSLLVDVARRLQGAVVDQMALPSAPDGYATITSGHFTVNTPDAGGTLLIVGPAGASIRLTAAESTVALVFAVAGGDHIESTTVRGHDALVSTRTRTIQGQQVTQRVMAWSDDLVDGEHRGRATRPCR